MPDISMQPGQSAADGEAKRAFVALSRKSRQALMLSGAATVLLLVSLRVSFHPLRVVAAVAALAMTIGLLRVELRVRSSETGSIEQIRSTLNLHRQALAMATGATVVLLLVLIVLGARTLPGLRDVPIVLSPEQDCVNQMTRIADAIDAYVIRTRTIPKAKNYEELREALGAAGGALPTNDPWGHTYEYSGERDSYALWSDGPPIQGRARDYGQNRITLRSGTFNKVPTNVRVDEARR